MKDLQDWQQIWLKEVLKETSKLKEELRLKYNKFRSRKKTFYNNSTKRINRLYNRIKNSLKIKEQSNRSLTLRRNNHSRNKKGKNNKNQERMTQQLISSRLIARQEEWQWGTNNINRLTMMMMHFEGFIHLN